MAEKAMQQFCSRLKVDKQNFTFKFNQITTPIGLRFYVSVVDGQGKTWLFYMMKKEGCWILTTPLNCPNWIIMLEQELNNIIQTNEGV